MFPPVMSGNGLPPSPAPAGSSSSSSAGKRERRRDSFDSLGREQLSRAVQLNQQHLLQQQQAGVHHQPLSASVGASSPGSPLRAPLAPRPHASPSRLHQASPQQQAHSPYTLPPHPSHASPQFAHNNGSFGGLGSASASSSSSAYAAGHGFDGPSSSSHTPLHHHFPQQAPPPLPPPPPRADPFPFPSLMSLNRSRLLHLLDHQIKLSSAPSSAVGASRSRSPPPPVDADSAAHYSALCSAIRTLNMAGGIFNFSFVSGTSIAHELLGQLHSATTMESSGGIHAHEGKVAMRLTARSIAECLAEIRMSPSATLAVPGELPPALLDAGVYYLRAELRPNASSASPPVPLLSPFVYHRALALLCFLLNLHLHQLTLARVLSLLQGIDAHLGYWARHQEISSLPKPYRLWHWLGYKWRGGARGHAASPHAAASIKLNPYRNWSKMAARHVRELLALKQLWTARCGRICVRMQRIQEWLSASFSRTAVPTPPSQSHTSAFFPAPRTPPSTAAPAAQFHHQIALNQRFFAKLYLYVCREELPHSVAHDDHARHFSPRNAPPVAHPSAEALAAGATGIEAKILSLQSQLASYDSFLVCLEHDFVPWFQSEIDRRRKPHHLWRYWHLYAMAGVVVGVGGFLAAKNQTMLRERLSDAWTALRLFWNEHATEPLKEIAMTITSTFNDRSLFSTNATALRKSKEDLAKMLATFGAHHARELAEHENTLQADFLRSIPARAAEGDMGLVMRTYEREIQHPIFSLLTGDLMRGFLIQVQKVKIDAEAAMLAADQILRSNSINFNIMATVPVILFAVLLGDLTNKWVLRSSWSSRKVREKVRRSKTILSELEQIMILHSGAQTHGAGAGTRGAPGSNAPAQFHTHPSRPHVHTRLASLSMEEFAALNSQEAEDEDEALRLASPRARQSASSSSSWSCSQAGGNDDEDNDGARSRSDSDVFGAHGSLTPRADAEISDEEADEIVEEWGGSATSPRMADVDAFARQQQQQPQGAYGAPASARTLFPSAVPAQWSATLPPALGLSNHAYGHTLLLIFQLSSLFASLPLSSAFSPAALSSTLAAGSEADPRLILHKDLLLLASHELTPDQKLRWITHMWRSYDFLKP